MLTRFVNYISDNIEKEKQRIYLWLPVLFGIGIGIYFLLPEESTKWLTLGVLEALIVIGLISRHYSQILKFILIAMMMVLGFAWMQMRATYVAKQIYPIPQAKTYLQGKIKKNRQQY